MNTFMFARASAWPMNSSSACGRSETSSPSRRLRVEKL
jgi:hypothetical protein